MGHLRALTVFPCAREHRMPSVTMAVSVYAGHHQLSRCRPFPLHPRIAPRVHRAACSSSGPHVNQSSDHLCGYSSPCRQGRFLLIPTSLNPTDPIQGGGPIQKAPGCENEGASRGVRSYYPTHYKMRRRFAPATRQINEHEIAKLKWANSTTKASKIYAMERLTLNTLGLQLLPRI
ncbi:hypothetical protein B0H14DRAFT_2682602 [Mycena olivaceomarginata]|nr:hypothetical protein B0H14DRAFT_2682602 [Mycena olivaceomarginata]